MMKISEDLKTALGQCFWVGINGTSATEESTRRIFDAFQPGGIILFQRNVKTLRQVKRLNAALQKRSSIPMLVAIDQEGGTVERLQDVIGTIPPAMAFVAAGSKTLIRRVHRSHARLLRHMGINVNFTPVLDLALRDADNAIGTRCYSNSPAVVTEWAREVIQVHLAEGVLTSGKHFPGLGDARLDTHVDLPAVASKWKKLEKMDLFPYRSLIDEMPFVMVNHALYPEKNDKLPASLSHEIVSELLLDDYGYPGLSISDDLIMGAVSKFYNLTEAGERALIAGNHMVLICKPEGVVEAYQSLLQKIAEQPGLMQAVLRASSRILAFKFTHLKKEFAPVNPETEIENMRRASETVSQEAITLARSHFERLKPGEPVTVYLPRTKWLKVEKSALGETLRNRRSKVTEVFYPIDLSEEAAKTLVDSSQTQTNIVVLANTFRFPIQKILAEGLLLGKKDVFLISGAFPFDSPPAGVRAALNTYWTAPPALEAAARVLLGERKAVGTSPLKV